MTPSPSSSSSSSKSSSKSSSTTTTSSSSSSSLHPTLIIFDLDDCLWSPEMFQLSSLPKVPTTDSSGEVVACSTADGDSVRLFPGARRVLSKLSSGGYGLPSSTLLAVASSSEVPSYSQSCLDTLTVNSRPLSSLFAASAIGRTGGLTSRKTTHVERLTSQLRTQSFTVDPSSTLFFDDCNWGDHVGDLETSLGIKGVRTPEGLTEELFEEGLARFRGGE